MLKRKENIEVIMNCFGLEFREKIDVKMVSEGMQLFTNHLNFFCMCFLTCRVIVNSLVRFDKGIVIYIKNKQYIFQTFAKNNTAKICLTGKYRNVLVSTFILHLLYKCKYSMKIHELIKSGIYCLVH